MVYIAERYWAARFAARKKAGGSGRKSHRSEDRLGSFYGYEAGKTFYQTLPIAKIKAFLQLLQTTIEYLLDESYSSLMIDELVAKDKALIGRKAEENGYRDEHG